jgi:6-phosphofructokinase 1
MENFNTNIKTLGVPLYDSPLDIPMFINEGERVVYRVEYDDLEAGFKKNGTVPSFENAGPRRKIFFKPEEVKAALVTCGGLCPGLNNVIQTIVRTLYYGYGVRKIYGIRYGYEGLIPEYGHAFMELHPDNVDELHLKGGTILGSSRGNQDVSAMVDTLEKNGINILFTIGGDGTLRGANAIQQEVEKRGLKISIAGVPKTIDNDINYVQKTFGFTTAVSEAVNSIHSAHNEAKGAKNGIGLVKVMGRDSGFIAAHVALASNDVNYVFIPEVPFRLEGEGGFYQVLHDRLKRKTHAVVLVAEGAGQDLVAGTGEKDASGNVKFGDVGLFFKDGINRYFKEAGFPVSIKYIDPSYLIRSVAAGAEDAVFCIMLAHNAVHGAMSGRTGFLVGTWNSCFTFLPFALATGERKKVDPKGYLWSTVTEATGQPDFI